MPPRFGRTALESGGFIESAGIHSSIRANRKDRPVYRHGHIGFARSWHAMRWGRKLVRMEGLGFGVRIPLITACAVASNAPVAPLINYESTGLNTDIRHARR